MTPWSRPQEPEPTPDRLYCYPRKGVLSTQNTIDMAQVSGEWIRSDCYAELGEWE